MNSDDWRIDLLVTPKYRLHPLHGLCGRIVGVLPSGTGGFEDRDGVFRIQMEVEPHEVFLAPADDWVTA